MVALVAEERQAGLLDALRRRFQAAEPAAAEVAAELREGIRLLIDTPPVEPESRDDILPDDSLSPVAPFRVVNIGNNDKVQLMDFITEIENCLGMEIKKNFMEMQKGDVPATWANADLLQRLTSYTPQTPVSEGVKHFVDWYRDYYNV